MRINIKWLLLTSIFSVGILFWLQCYYTFLKNWKATAILMILLALLFTLSTKGQEKQIFFIVPFGLIIANIIQIIIEVFSDPTSHNLWPFEIILFASTGFVSALIGTGLGFIIKRISKSSERNK